MLWAELGTTSLVTLSVNFHSEMWAAIWWGYGICWGYAGVVETQDAGEFICEKESISSVFTMWGVQGTLLFLGTLALVILIKKEVRKYVSAH